MGASAHQWRASIALDGVVGIPIQLSGLRPPRPARLRAVLYRVCWIRADVYAGCLGLDGIPLPVNETRTLMLGQITTWSPAGRHEMFPERACLFTKAGGS